MFFSFIDAGQYQDRQMLIDVFVESDILKEILSLLTMSATNQSSLIMLIILIITTLVMMNFLFEALRA